MVCPLVFSHRGLVGDPTFDAKAFFLRDDPIRDAQRHSIHAFDLDLTFTTNGSILVGHPEDVKQALGVDIWAQTDKSLENRPLLWLDRLLDMTSMDENVTLALDLKGSDREPYPKMLAKLAKAVRVRALQRRVWLWIDRPVQQLKFDLHKRHGVNLAGLTLLKPLRDRSVVGGTGGQLDCSVLIDRRDVRHFAMLGPSAKCANRWLAAPRWAADAWGPNPTSRTPARWLVWVVDDPHSLKALVRLKVANVVSNRPKAIMENCDAHVHGGGIQY